jgi:hypothetical protein
VDYIGNKKPFGMPSMSFDVWVLCSTTIRRIDNWVIAQARLSHFWDKNNFRIKTFRATGL